MRVLLRDLQTGKFYKREGEWTFHASEALDFGETDRAAEVARELRLVEVDVLLVNPDGRPIMGMRVDSNGADAQG